MPTRFSRSIGAGLQQPAEALSLAQKAAEATGRGNPFILDTLAWAYF